MKKSPAFQWYPKDFLVDTQLLTAEQVGAYMRLLSNAWVGLPGHEQGYLPSDPVSLARLSGVSVDHWKEIAEPVLALFESSNAQASPGIYHKRLLEELRKQKKQSKKRKERAYKGAKARWGNKIETNSESMLEASNKQCLDDAFLADADEEEDSPRGGRGKPEDLSRGFKEAFKVWASTLPRSRGPSPKPNNARRTKYEARRREGYDQEAILAALTNWIHDPWEGRMQGIGTYDMAVLLRSGATVEKFAAMRPSGERPAPPDQRAAVLSRSIQDEALRRLDAGEIDDATYESIGEAASRAEQANDRVAALEQVKEIHGL